MQHYTALLNFCLLQTQFLSRSDKF